MRAAAEKAATTMTASFEEASGKMLASLRKVAEEMAVVSAEGVADAFAFALRFQGGLWYGSSECRSIA
jgi:hypothetical protein